MSRAPEVVGKLTDKYFHSVKSDRTTIELQGKFLWMASPGVYVVQLYDWIIGAESEQLLVPVAEMRFWKIYATEGQWRAAYAQYSKQRAGSL